MRGTGDQAWGSQEGVGRGAQRALDRTGSTHRLVDCRSQIVKHGQAAAVILWDGQQRAPHAAGCALAWVKAAGFGCNSHQSKTQARPTATLRQRFNPIRAAAVAAHRSLHRRWLPAWWQALRATSGDCRRAKEVRLQSGEDSAHARVRAHTQCTRTHALTHTSQKTRWFSDP